MVIEKPFGRDLDSAVELNERIRAALRERQIYRIDHYLGKETVQNLMVFRFANGIFEPVWDRRYIDHVQIMVAETVGVEDRGNYYETAGVLRDSMVGDSTLFHRADIVEDAWRIATPILDVWQSLRPRDFPNYAAGTMRPVAADRLIQHDGRRWWDSA